MRLTADRVKVSGPKMDGGFTVSFEVGEYEQAKVAQLLMIPQSEAVTLTVDAA